MARRPPNVRQFRGYAPKPRLGRRARVSPILVMLPLAAFAAVFLWDGGPPGLAMGFGEPPPALVDAAAADPERARFGRCAGAVRVDCVVDGDTFWYGGDKIRIADINTPETGRPHCAAEAARGEAATARLQALLNAGPFTLEAADRDRDAYGRRLRVVTRAGASLGETLVAEGLAERWRGYRGSWC